MINKIKVYLCARISKDAQEWNSLVCDSLNYPISVFMPQKHNPWNLKHTSFPKEVYELDLMAIKESHICLVLPIYGRDCAWEIGWYSNSVKPVLVFIDNQVEWLKDWMIKGGIDYVATSSRIVFNLLKKDPILKYKNIFFVKKINELNNLIKKIYRLHYE
ncbi:hypothetical protein COU54_00035 [Candidatus Pacearchaeota archaeon CG10_big_fil_rev_8_21_14_0_10_31_24]|nr:MAG: hypothetical protein COU54_00035 [Candidatus Pacearchaeota archaeon CG10_big_fil_rev_8_21_14_0_10_31_24]